MNERRAKALMANFGTKIFHASDPETAEFASGHAGKELEQFTSYSVRGEGGEPGGSISEHYEPSLKVKEMLIGLRTGGDANGRVVDGIVIRSRPFVRTGTNFIKVAFDQR